MTLINGQRVEHPNWLDDNRRRAGTVTHVPNEWHADILFDGWVFPVRAAQASLELVEEEPA